MWQNILQSFQQELNTLSNTWSFAPAWAVWGVLLIGVFAVACFVHTVALAFLNRILRQRRPHLIRLLTATKNPTRLALLLIALAGRPADRAAWPGRSVDFHSLPGTGHNLPDRLDRAEGAAYRRQSLSAQFPYRRSRQSVGPQTRDAGARAGSRARDNHRFTNLGHCADDV